MEAVDFVSHFDAGSAWAVKKGNPNKVATSDLCGLKIAVQTGTTQEEEVNAAAKRCKADGKSEVQILSNKLQTDVTTNVVTGKPTCSMPIRRLRAMPSRKPMDSWKCWARSEGVAPEGIVIKKRRQPDG